EQTGNLFWGSDARNRDLAGSENAYAATALLCISRAQKSASHEINRSALKQKANGAVMAFAFLNRYRTVAPPGYSRWLIPPAALCVHLCIGQAYAFSVFNLPMTKLIGISQSAPDDWKLTELGWIFSIAIFFLGASAAVFGHWVEEGGPRRAMFTSALCWAGGFFVSAIGVYLHSLWFVYLGYGVLGGIGLGLGYISPVSTLIRWFPDRPGMATGMAIMGF